MDRGKKQKIAENFSKAAPEYDNFSQPIYRWGIELIQLIDKNIYPKRILDIGMGTANMTFELKKIFPNINNIKIFGCDLALGMIKRAQEKFFNEEFYLIVADFEALPFINSSFDLIFSNSSYQWAENLYKAMKEANRILSKGGKFYFNILINKTFSELIYSLKKLKFINNTKNFFIEEKFLMDMLKKLGFSCIYKKNLIDVIFFYEFIDFLRWLKKIGANIFFKNKIKSLGDTLKLAKFYEKNFSKNNKIYTTFHILFLYLEKIF